MNELIFLLIGLIAGAAIGFFFAGTRRHNKLDQQKDLGFENARLQENIRIETERRKALEAETQRLRDENSRVMAENASLKTEWANTRQRLTEQKQELESMGEKMNTQFKNLANEILEEKSKKFTDQNKSNIGEILNPLKEKILEFEKKVEDSSRESLKWNSSLTEQLRQLKDLNQKITKEAENLTKALKGDTKTQGNWGEFILESILEKSGLQKGQEFIVQESTLTETGRLRPDVVIKLPEGKSIVIDSKVSLVAYEQAVNAESDEDREQQLRMHILSVKNHIKQLSAKSYHNLYGVEGLDFILLFVPIEPAFSMALQSEPDLFNHAFEKQIVLVSPTTLLATLRTVANIWRYEYQNRNVLEIARQAGDMYDKFVAFSDDLVKLGQQMDTAKKSYSDAMNKLAEGRGNLVKKAEDIRLLGAKTSKQMSDKLLTRSNEEQ